MYLPDSNSLVPTAAALKKRKRDLEGGGAGGMIWNQDHLTAENSAGFTIHQGDDAATCQLDYHDVHDQHMNISPSLPMPRFFPSKQMDLDSTSSRPRLQPSLSKRRRIQQQHQQWSAPFSRPATGQSKQHIKPSLSSLTIPPGSLDDLSSLKSSPEISPRTVAPLPPPLLRPCHVCHRRPTTRVMLNAYADCELCGQRACYICLRECNAVGCRTATITPGGIFTQSKAEEEQESFAMKDGCIYARQQQQNSELNTGNYQRKICSCCAVEGLTEAGDEIVWCLDCVRRGHDQHHSRQQYWP